jgi:hypothetical protein
MKRKSPRSKSHSQKQKLGTARGREHSNLNQESEELNISQSAPCVPVPEIQHESIVQPKGRSTLEYRRTGDGARRWRDPIVASTVIIAAAALVNLFVSYGMWSATRDYTEVTRNIFSAANRPYVGVFSYKANKNEANRIISISVEYKNFGTVLAKDIAVKWDIFVDGKPSQKVGVPDRPSVLFPQVPAELAAVISEPAYSPVVNGTSVLEVEVKITYKGIGKEEYYTYEKSRYVPEWNRFIAISGDAR